MVVNRSAAEFQPVAAHNARRIKVLHVGKFYPPYHGGMESHLQTLCAQLLPEVAVEVLVSNTSRETRSEVADGVPVTRLGNAATLGSSSINLAMAARIHRSDADVIHLHWPNPQAALAYLASCHKAPLVVSYHSDVVRQQVLGRIFSPILHAVLRRARSVIVTSPNYIESSAILDRHRDRCRVVPLGIAEECFEVPDPEAIRELRRTHGENLILSVGRLVYYKGFGHLIEAMASAPGKLLIAGDGPLKTELVTLANSLGLTDRVVFLGSPSDPRLRCLYHAADLFVLASTARSEAFGLVQAEAMAAGKPVINTSLASGVPFVSQHNITGLTVPPADSSALAAAITRLMGDASLRAAMGRAGRQRAKALFGSKKMAEQTVRIYESALGSPKVKYVTACA
jgi:glycosyltransferase involved in cell wall biosynthesis